MKTDKWRQLRAEMNLFGNTEPEVKLMGLTVPGEPDTDGMSFVICGGSFVESWQVEREAARAAAVSTGAKIKDHEKTIKSLLKLRHDTPFEAIQFNFQISGISKACGAQLSRHRVGQGHISSSRRYQEQGVSFVYPLLDSIDSEITARAIYSTLSSNYTTAYDSYLAMRNLGAKKGDARYVIPTASASERVWWVNARALRDFFRLRLPKDAEWEIRRLANMTLAIVKRITPTIFHDFEEDN